MYVAGNAGRYTYRGAMYFVPVGRRSIIRCLGYPHLMAFTRKSCFIFAVLGWLSSAAASEPGPVHESVSSDQLPEPVVQILQRYRMSLSSVSVYAREIGSGSLIAAVGASTPRNPASVIKLLPTLVALEELGAAYTWKTEVYATARIEHGQLEGDLYLKGYGDPYFLTEHFWRLLHGLRSAGIDSIRGDLVLDRSFLEPEPVDPAKFDGQPYRVYNATPNALLVNFQAVSFRFEPDPAQRSLRITADPRLANVEIHNNIRLSKGRCRNWRRRIKIRVDQTADDADVYFSGRYTESCKTRELFRVVNDPARHVFGVFKTLWAEQGGRFSGDLREEMLPADARLLYTAYSPPLGNVVRSINKYSNNIMARQLLLTLGAEVVGPPGNTAKGLQVVQLWLERRNLRFPELVLENGTGLSRQARLSAAHLGELLLWAYNSPNMPEFVSSLPISGVDGTLQGHYTNSDLKGRLHAKTGTIDNVRALAGYLLDAKGRRVVLVYLQNQPGAHLRSGERVQDAFVVWLYRRP